MKKRFVLILTMCLCMILSACMGNPAGGGKIDTSEVFKVSDYSIWLTTPNGWEECEDFGSFDLQCQSPMLDMYLSVFRFSTLDLGEGQTAQNLFELQTESLLSARDNVSEIEPVSSTEDEEKIVYSALYSAEREGVKNYYVVFFVQFKNTDDMAWILFTGMPSVVEKNREIIDDIITKVQNSEPEKEQQSL